MVSVSVDLRGLVVEGDVGVLSCFSEYECDRVKSAIDFFCFMAVLGGAAVFCESHISYCMHTIGSAELPNPTR